MQTYDLLKNGLLGKIKDLNERKALLEKEWAALTNPLDRECRAARLTLLDQRVAEALADRDFATVNKLRKQRLDLQNEEIPRDERAQKIRQEIDQIPAQVKVEARRILTDVEAKLGVEALAKWKELMTWIDAAWDALVTFERETGLELSSSSKSNLSPVLAPSGYDKPEDQALINDISFWIGDRG